VFGVRDADFEETAPASPSLLITRLVCSLSGKKQAVFISRNSLVYSAYGKSFSTEQFTCNFGLNEVFFADMFKDGLSIVGKDTDGNARIVELESHPFFIATLFQPQLSSKSGAPHPLITGFVKAAMSFQSHGVNKIAQPKFAPDR